MSSRESIRISLIYSLYKSPRTRKEKKVRVKLRQSKKEKLSAIRSRFHKSKLITLYCSLSTRLWAITTPLMDTLGSLTIFPTYLNNNITLTCYPTQGHLTKPWQQPQPHQLQPTLNLNMPNKASLRSNQLNTKAGERSNSHSSTA